MNKILTLHIFLACHIKNGTVVPFKVMKAYRRSDMGPLFNLGSTCRSVVNFTTRPLYPRARTPVPIEYWAWRVPEQLWTSGRREKSHAVIRIPHRPLRSLVKIPTALSQLRQIIFQDKCQMKEFFHFHVFPTTYSTVLEKLIVLHLAKKILSILWNPMVH